MSSKRAAAASGKISGIVRDTAKSNMAEITKACAGNVELQTVLLDQIKKYQKAKTDGTLVTTSTPRKKKEDTEPESAKRLAAVEGLQAKILNRNQMLYKKWSVDMLRAMVAYCDPTLSWSWLLSFAQKERFLEMLEYAFGIDIFGGKPDRTASLDMSMLLPRLKRVYESNGSLLSPLPASCEGGFVDWSKHGHYSLEVVDSADGKALNITCRPLKKTVTVGQHITEGDATLDSAMLRRNFCLKAAFAATSSDTYNLSHFFPELGRSLRKRLSEEAGVTNPIPGGGGNSTKAALSSLGSRPSGPPLTKRARCKQPPDTVVAASGGAPAEEAEPEEEEEGNEEEPPSPEAEG